MKDENNFNFDFADDDELEEEDDAHFNENVSESETFDIPDLPGYITGLIRRGADEAVQNWRESYESENGTDDLTVESIYDVNKRERISGITRSLLSTRRKQGTTFGASLCSSLATDLKKYTDKLLFGMIERLYLHTTRSITFHNDRICASVRIFWDPEESPYPLDLNAAAISENPALVYLLVGDLVSELIADLEKNAERSNKQ